MSLEQQFTKMEARRKQLLATFANQSDETVNRTPKGGGWSAIQVIQHLITAESGSVIYLRKKLPSIDTVPMSGFGNWLNYQKIQWFLILPIKIKAPAVVATVPEHSSLTETIAKWGQARQDLYQLLASLKPEDLNRAIFKHPLAGYINLNQMLRFMDLHVKHHEKQVARALAKP